MSCPTEWRRRIVRACAVAVMVILYGRPLAQAQTTAGSIDLSSGLTPAQSIRAGDAPGPDASQPSPSPSGGIEEGGISDYFANWFNRVALAQSEQPSWMAALVTPPVGLVEQVRYDQYIEHLGNDASVRNFGVNKGLQLIPTDTEEVDILVPSYLERDNVKPGTGFADWQFALFKQRLASAGPQNGNYVVSASISATAPTGASHFTNHVYFVAPSIAAAKGWGNFDIQASFGASIPTSRSQLYGNSLIGNAALQYRLEKVIWPEVEFNWTKWLNGKNYGGDDQLLMTVGAVVGKIKIINRLGIALGLGYQFPLAPSYRAKPALLPTYNRNWIASLRMPF